MNLCYSLDVMLVGAESPRLASESVWYSTRQKKAMVKEESNGNLLMGMVLGPVRETASG